MRIEKILPVLLASTMNLPSIFWNNKCSVFCMTKLYNPLCIIVERGQWHIEDADLTMQAIANTPKILVT